MHIAPLDVDHARSIVVLTGAGISVASGLRPFRGPGGLWNEDDFGPNGLDAATMAQEPQRIWQFVDLLRDACQTAQPNAGHRALAALERRVAGRASFLLVTQNIDGLHQAAGSQQVLELHGNALRSRCTSCSRPSFSDPLPRRDVPRCTCGAVLRPDIVLFNEEIPLEAERRSTVALRDCDLFLAIGTSGTVYPAAGFVRAAAYAGATTVLVNVEAPRGDCYFQRYALGRAEDVLPTLFGIEA